jgi:Uma2 family endonuclease
VSIVQSLVSDEPTLVAILGERTRRGIAKFDECWEGVWHLSPSPNLEHQRFTPELCFALKAALSETADVFLQFNLADPKAGLKDFRIPDVMAVRRGGGAVVSDTCVSGPADLVIEVRSPDDETYDKLPFYARLGVHEVVIIDRDAKAIEVARLDPQSLQMTLVSATRAGVMCASVPIGLRQLEGGKVEIRPTDGPGRWVV